MPPVPARLGVPPKCIFISAFLCTFVVIPTFCNSPELSRSDSRRLLSIITKTLHNPTSGCPDFLIFSESEADQLLQKNHSYLLPFRSKYSKFLQSVVSPLALHNSYRRDIVRAASLAELVINWLSLNDLMLVEGSVVNVDAEHFLEPLMRAFTQTSSYYPRRGDASGRGSESVVNSVTICVGSEPLMYVEQSTGDDSDSRPPTNLCALMTHILEGSTLKLISSTVQIFGVWAPLHCNPGTTALGKKIPLHLILPIPHTKSASVVLEFDLRNLTLDLCAVGLDYCRHSTTQCVYRQYQAWPFDVVNYICQCKPGFYTDRVENGYQAELYMQEKQKSSSGGGSESESRQSWDRMSCKVCPPDCPNCTSGMVSGVEYNMHLLRGIPLAVQTFSITLTLLLGVLTFRLRRTRVFKAANWIFLEIFLLGAELLYSTCIVMYFRASSPTCILLPWFREVGFSLMYGVLIVKLYRVLICFQSRKAHRVHVRDKDLFKYLGCFVVIVICYMLAWTAVTLDYTRFRNFAGAPNIHTNSILPIAQQPSIDGILVKGRIQITNMQPLSSSPLTPLIRSSSSPVPNTTFGCDLSHCHTHFDNVSVANLTSSGRMGEETMTAALKIVQEESKPNGAERKGRRKNETSEVQYQYFRVCRSMSWDIVVQLGEMAILLVGIHYCRLIWSAASEYNENRCITIALLIELAGSGTLYLTRHFIWYSTHPDVTYLIYFVTCHLTVTLNIAIIFGPKFWYIHKPPPPQVGAMVVGVGGGRRGMVGAVPGASAAPHLVPSNNKLRLASNGELDLADVNLADMDPEVIRRELKRLYTAIEIYKTKAMRRDNPHISKRRGGRKQRRFSLQPFHKKHHGGGVGDCASGYQGDVSTISNVGSGEPNAIRPGTGGGKSALVSGSMLDEEASRVSEGSFTSYMDTMEQRSTSQLGVIIKSKTQSTPHEYARRQETTGCGNGGASDG